MRVLVTTNAAVGHFLPMVATINALLGQGHAVRVACPASFEATVVRAGFDVWACPETDEPIANVPPAPDGADARLRWAIESSWPSDCRRWIGPLMQRSRRWRPDVVIVEPVEHGGRIVAAALHIPLIVHGWGFTLPEATEERAAFGLSDLYDRYATQPATPALVADLGPAALQAHDAGPALRYRFVATRFTDDPLPPPRSDTPRVLVTVGTYPNQSSRDVITTASLAALAAGAEIVAVLGHTDRGSPDSYPGDITVLPWVDMPAAIATSDLVVHHGGAGTSLATVCAGRPAVIVPQSGDQFRNAALLARAGVAETCSTNSTDQVSAAIRRGLEQPAQRSPAAAIAETNSHLPDSAALARQIAATT